MEKYQNLDRYQDFLGQLPLLQSYTQGIYFFPQRPEVTRDEIVSSLENAITKVRKAIPWMGARVVNEGKGPGSSGHYRAVPCPAPQLPLFVLDVSEEFPEYSVFQQHKASLSLLPNARRLTTVPGFPHKVDVQPDQEVAYSTLLQVNFVRGGVLLSINTQHNLADAGGFFLLIKAVAMAMRGEEFPVSLIAAANRDRRNAVPLLGPGEPLLDHSNQIRPPVTAKDPVASTAKARNHVFHFSPAALAAIKEMASTHEGAQADVKVKDGSQNGGAPPAVRFISTDDAICAFYWKHLTRARGYGDQHNQGSQKKTRFTRQMDGRRVMGLPADYTGVMSHTAICTLDAHEVASGWPLRDVAAALRGALDAASTAYHLRSIATLVAGTADRSTITYTGAFDPGLDVGSSSWRSFGSAGGVGGGGGAFPDFGPLLGRPEFLRRPPTLPFPGTVMLFPSADGGCDANACLTEGEFAALAADAEWNEHVEYVG